MSLELALNYYGTRTHWSDSLESNPYGLGKVGYPLCSQMDQVWDLEASNHSRKQYGERPVSLDGKPMCKRCEWAKAKREAA